LNEIGSTHIQSYLFDHKNELEREKVCLSTARNLGAKGFNDIITDIRDNNSTSEYFLSMKTCLEKGMNPLLSAEGLCELPVDEIMKLKSFILGVAAKNPVEIKIILYYREWLNFIYSTYAELAKSYNARTVSFPEFLLVEGDDLITRNSVQFPAMMKNYISVFGEKNFILVDYYGVQARKRDIAYVFVCEILKVMCLETALLNGDKRVVRHENEKPNAVYLHYIYLFNLYLNTHLMQLCTRDYRTNAAYIEELTKRNITFPAIISKLSLFREDAMEKDRKFHKDYGQLMLYNNHTANAEKIQLFQFEEVDIAQFSQNASWQLFMNKEMLSFIHKREICSLKPDHHKIILDQGKIDE
jgi:hypothetical protein